MHQPRSLLPQHGRFRGPTRECRSTRETMIGHAGMKLWAQTPPQVAPHLLITQFPQIGRCWRNWNLQQRARLMVTIDQFGTCACCIMRQAEWTRSLIQNRSKRSIAQCEALDSGERCELGAEQPGTYSNRDRRM